MSQEYEQQKIMQVDLEREMKKSYIDYAMSVIVGRALPDVRVGTDITCFVSGSICTKAFVCRPSSVGVSARIALPASSCFCCSRS